MTPPVPGRLVCDLSEVTRVEPVAAAMLAPALEHRAAQGYEVVLEPPHEGYQAHGHDQVPAEHG